MVLACLSSWFFGLSLVLFPKLGNIDTSRHREVKEMEVTTELQGIQERSSDVRSTSFC
jgi:hypothetical protein